MSYLLVAEDDPDDCFLVEEAWQEACLEDKPITPRFVHNGEHLLNLLEVQKQLPALILLDLNMPILDGRRALKQIKENLETCKIPVVVLSTSSHQHDVQYVYTLGASGFIQKPSSYEELVDIMKSLSSYWFNTVSLPECKR